MQQKATGECREGRRAVVGSRAAEREAGRACRLRGRYLATQKQAPPAPPPHILSRPRTWACLCGEGEREGEEEEEGLFNAKR
jgi:hypothetical protein